MAETVGGAAAPRRFPRVHTRRRATVIAEEQAASTSAPTMTRGSVPKEAIDAARVEFLRRRIAWEDHEAYDATEEEEDGDVAVDLRVEIARNVTAAMVKRIPQEWLSGVEVQLNPNGVLELVDAETGEHNQVKGHVYSYLTHYVITNIAEELAAYLEKKRVYHNQELKPDIVLSSLLPQGQAQGLAMLPIVVVEVEVSHHSVPEFIQRARLILSELHVQRVVVFKFFRSRRTGLVQQPPLLRMAALAVVFERVGAPQPGALADIRVVDEVSFGTAPLDNSAYQNLSEVPSRTIAAHQRRPIPASRFEQINFETGNIKVNFPNMPAHNWVVQLNNLPPITFDLCAILQIAILGWRSDHLP